MNIFSISTAEKDRELGVASSEIKALRATIVLKDKALEEVHIIFVHISCKSCENRY